MGAGSAEHEHLPGREGGGDGQLRPRAPAVPASPHPSSREARELADLRAHWSRAYDITVDAGSWRARHLDGDACLTAPSADGLRRAIWEHYQQQGLLRIGAPDVQP